MGSLQQLHAIILGTPYLSGFVLVCAVLSLGYVLIAIHATAAFKRVPGTSWAGSPPISVLKPVCGLEAGLYQNLRSFCQQSYRRYQVIFGISSPTDPAIDSIRALIREFPELDLELVIDPRLIGSNRKVSNLANMLGKARHELLVIADSDMQVGPDYLPTVAACFANPRVGAATCLYTGKSSGGLASSLGASYINQWFLPSVLVALRFQKLRFCFGATMAVRREVLAAIGGFERLASVLADDYQLGNLVHALGYQVALVPYLVRNTVHETSLASLFRHELRWARTVRSVQPLGYSLSILTHVVPMSLLYLAVTPTLAYGFSVLSVAVGLRVLAHLSLHRHLELESPIQVWLLPLRDLLSFSVWMASFFGNRIEWRQHQFNIQANGLISHSNPESQ